MDSKTKFKNKISDTFLSFVSFVVNKNQRDNRL